MKRLIALALFALSTSVGAATLTVTGCDSYAITTSGSDVAVGCVKSGTVTPPAPTPAPTPSPVVTPGLERFDAAPSDWARWTFWQSSEFAPLQTRLQQKYGWTALDAGTRINQQINAYQSTLKLRGYRTAGTNSYTFYKLLQDGGAATPDVNGAADAYIAMRFPGVIPGPLK